MEKASSDDERPFWTEASPGCGIRRERCLSTAHKGEPNAQAEDEVGREKALQGYWNREGSVSAVWQAPRHDQAQHEAGPRPSRNQGAVQDRWRQHQEILVAEQLTRWLTRWVFQDISRIQEIDDGPRQTGCNHPHQA